MRHQRYPEAQWDLLKKQLVKGEFNPLAFAHITSFATAQSCKTRLTSILQALQTRLAMKKPGVSKAAAEALTYRYDQDEEWVAYWVKRRESANKVHRQEKRKRAAEKVIDLGVEEVINELEEEVLAKRHKPSAHTSPVKQSFVHGPSVSATPIKQNINQTPIKANCKVPKRIMWDESSDSTLTDAESVDWSDVDDENDTMKLLCASFSGLKDIKTDQHATFGGVDLHKLLLNVQQGMVNGNVKTPKTIISRNSAYFLATRSCIILDDKLPEEYRPYISDDKYTTLRTEFAEWKLRGVELAVHSKKSIAMFIKCRQEKRPYRCMVDEEEEKENYALAIKEANVLESMYEHVGLIEPEKTSEPTFTARYIWPLLTFMNGTKSNVDIDISTDSGAERPDIHVWTRKKNLKRVILEGEVKTSWASESAREKEVPRVISKVMAAFRSEISLTYNDTTTPKIALSIQGTTGRVYYVFLFERLFVAYFAGYLNAITHLDETETVLLEKCLSGWKELGGRSDGIRRALKVPEKTPSKSAAKRLLPPNPEQYNLKLF